MLQAMVARSGDAWNEQAVAGGPVQEVHECMEKVLQGESRMAYEPA